MSDADKFAAADTRHDLCDQQPCNECIVWGECPRCGEQTLNISNEAMNALSRRTRGNEPSVYVCSGCGTEEAFEDMGAVPKKEWARPIEASK